MLRPNLYSLLAALVLTFAVPGMLAAQSPYGSPPMGYHGHPVHGAHPAVVHHGHYPPMCPPHGAGHQPPIVDHYVQKAPSLWDDQQPIEHFVCELTQRSWLKLEYLHWNIERPGNFLAGANVSGLRSRDQQFEGFDNLNGGISVGTSQLFSNERIDLDDISGIRGTWGLALEGGHMELSFFGTEQIYSTSSTGNLKNFRFPPDTGFGNPTSPNVLMALTTNGVVQPTSTMNAIVFDESATATMGSQMWGAELSLLTDLYKPGDGFNWQWLGGFRYVNLDESYRFRGVYNAGNTLADRVTRIDSTTINNIYGPQVGGRASLALGWLTLSATPRVTFGLNDYSAKVSSDPLDTGIVTREMRDEIEFCTVTQLTLSAEAQLNNHLSIYGGYDYLWMPRISRPMTNIRYNSFPGPGGDFEPDIGLNNKLKNFLVEGFSVGAVFRY